MMQVANCFELQSSTMLRRFTKEIQSPTQAEASLFAPIRASFSQFEWYTFTGLLHMFMPGTALMAKLRPADLRALERGFE